MVDWWEVGVGMQLKYKIKELNKTDEKIVVIANVLHGKKIVHNWEFEFPPYAADEDCERFLDKKLSALRKEFPDAEIITKHKKKKIARLGF